MPQPLVPHFQESGRINPVSIQDRMPAPAFGIALDHLVITCVDLVFVNRDRLLLARRNQYPRKSWWIIGGRMVAGESPIQTAQRKACQEAHLAHLAPDRFRYLGAFSTCFARRTQAPQHHGLHSVNLTYQLSLTDAEIAQIQLIPTEYEAAYKWVNLDEMETFLAAETSGTRDAMDQVLLAIGQMVKRPDSFNSNI
jgi:ADP-ribose pyrophosphatase YjhB (NUDIX family)